MNNIDNLLKNVIYLDIETTGLNPETEKIIEIGAVKVKNAQVSYFNQPINPETKVKLAILNLCKDIKQEELDIAPKIEEIENDLIYFLEDLPIICHNAGFEKSFFKHHLFREIKNTFLDSLDLANIVYLEQAQHNLEYMIQNNLGENRKEEHRGLQDSLDTKKVVEKIFKTLQSDTELLACIQENLPAKHEWEWSKYIAKINYILNIPIK